MEDRKLEQEIKESIKRGTNQSLQMKEEIWNNIEGRLMLDQKANKHRHHNKGENNMRMKKRGTKKSWITGAVAAVLIGVLSTTTNTGQAFIDTIKEYFAPQKKVVDEIEGMPEEKEVQLKEGQAGYIIYIDEEMYQLVQEGEVDRIIPKVPLDTGYPEVSMEIRQEEAKLPEELAQDIQNVLKERYPTVHGIELVSIPVEGLVVSAIEGNQWDSVVERYYIVSNDKEGSFVIKQTYFLEAAEGHGARFDHMLKEFRVVDLDQK